MAMAVPSEGRAFRVRKRSTARGFSFRCAAGAASSNGRPAGQFQRARPRRRSVFQQRSVRWLALRGGNGGYRGGLRGIRSLRLDGLRSGTWQQISRPTWDPVSGEAIWEVRVDVCRLLNKIAIDRDRGREGRMEDVLNRPPCGKVCACAVLAPRHAASVGARTTERPFIATRRRLSSPRLAAGNPIETEHRSTTYEERSGTNFRRLSMTSAPSFVSHDVPTSLPSAGPGVSPQLIEIDVAPWQRIAVMFRASQAVRNDESGTIWYWRPDSVTRLDR